MGWFGERIWLHKQCRWIEWTFSRITNYICLDGNFSYLMARKVGWYWPALSVGVRVGDGPSFCRLAGGPSTSWSAMFMWTPLFQSTSEDSTTHTHKISLVPHTRRLWRPVSQWDANSDKRQRFLRRPTHFVPILNANSRRWSPRIKIHIIVISRNGITKPIFRCEKYPIRSIKSPRDVT